MFYGISNEIYTSSPATWCGTLSYRHGRKQMPKPPIGTQGFMLPEERIIRWGWLARVTPGQLAGWRKNKIHACSKRQCVNPSQSHRQKTTLRSVPVGLGTFFVDSVGVASVGVPGADGRQIKTAEGGLGIPGSSLNEPKQDGRTEIIMEGYGFNIVAWLIGYSLDHAMQRYLPKT